MRPEDRDTALLWDMREAARKSRGAPSSPSETCLPTSTARFSLTASGARRLSVSPS